MCRVFEMGISQNRGPLPAPDSPPPPPPPAPPKKKTQTKIPQNPQTNSLYDGNPVQRVVSLLKGKLPNPKP